eukprot:491919_1
MNKNKKNISINLQSIQNQPRLSLSYKSSHKSQQNALPIESTSTNSSPITQTSSTFHSTQYLSSPKFTFDISSQQLSKQTELQRKINASRVMYNIKADSNDNRYNNQNNIKIASFNKLRKQIKEKHKYNDNNDNNNDNNMIHDTRYYYIQINCNNG